MKEKLNWTDILIVAMMFMTMVIGAMLNAIFSWSDSLVIINEEIKNPTWVYCILGAFGGVCVYMPMLLLAIEVKRLFHKN